jgi:hypothetical protein
LVVLVGLTEILPVANILKKVPKKALEDLPTRELILEYMKSAAQSGRYEGCTRSSSKFNAKHELLVGYTVINYH